MTKHGDASLAEFERAWLDGDLRSLMWAVSFCHNDDRPLPKWVADETLKVLEEACSDEKNVSHERWTALHTWRWRYVKYLRDLPSDVFLKKTGYKKGVTRAYMIVADIEGKYVKKFVATETVRSSHAMVENAIKAGKGARYLAMTYPILPRQFCLAFPRECVKK